MSRTMSTKRPAHAEGTAKVGASPTVPNKITAPLDEPQEALQNAARAEAEREHNANIVRTIGIDPDKLTAAEIKMAAGLLGTITRNHCAAGANARRPNARAKLKAFIAAHPDACKNLSVTIDD
jgi:hypothetical protein